MNIIKFEKKKDKVVHKDIVRELEELLELAKEGHIKGFTGVVLLEQDVMDYCISGEVMENYLNFMGMLSDLQLNLKNQYDE